MSVIKAINTINRLNRLIENRSTGTPSQLADKLDMSRGTLYKLIDELKSYDAPILYSRTRETFYYAVNFSIRVDLTIFTHENNK